MPNNAGDTLATFLGELIQARMNDKKQIRLPKKQLVSMVSEHLDRVGKLEDPVVAFESWEPELRQSRFVGDYFVKYNAYTEILNVQWIPTWKNIEWAAEIRDRQVSSEIRMSIQSLSSYEFEILLQQVFSKVPWTKDVRVTGKTGDGGIDFEGLFIEPQSGLDILLLGQAKHWTSKVGSDSIRTFIGSISLRARGRPAVGIYVSTGGFTNDAERTAQSSQMKVLTFDLDRMVGIMIQNKIGVSEVTIRALQMDGGFWDDLQE